MLGAPNFCLASTKIPPSERRNVKRVVYHPRYHPRKGEFAKDMPIYDFALIEVDKPMSFNEKMQPICLPPKRFWFDREPEKFINHLAHATGYGRVENEIIEGKDQTSCQALKAALYVIDSEDPRCSIVIISQLANYLLF